MNPPPTWLWSEFANASHKADITSRSWTSASGSIAGWKIFTGTIVSP